jgi:hypothetical protein
MEVLVHPIYIAIFLLLREVLMVETAGVAGTSY